VISTYISDTAFLLHVIALEGTLRSQLFLISRLRNFFSEKFEIAITTETYEALIVIYMCQILNMLLNIPVIRKQCVFYVRVHTGACIYMCEFYICTYVCMYVCMYACIYIIRSSLHTQLPIIILYCSILLHSIVQ
jgi:hypothetical protein